VHAIQTGECEIGTSQGPVVEERMGKDSETLAPELPGAAIPTNINPARSILWAAFSVIVVLCAAGGYWFGHRHGGSASDRARSIAVLPFQPLAAGSDDEHLGLGMADAVITRLSNVRQLPVRPTDVVIRYSDPRVDPVKAAREMGVDTVLTGKVQRSGDHVRVTVQLIRSSDGQPLWAETFDDKYNGIFEVEDSISEKVAQALAIKLGSSERLQLQRHYTENIDAYRYYLMGRYEEFTFTRDGMNKSIDYFNRAIDMTQVMLSLMLASPTLGPQSPTG